MGTKYTTQSASGYNSSPPADDGTQVASNLVTWAGVKTKLADPIKTLADAENTALVAALDLSARAISSPDTAIASDHWKTLQVTGATTITLSSAASMGAGYEVGVFNAGTGVVTVTPGAAADTINGVSASVTVSIKGTKIFRTNQALTGYNVVGGYDPQTLTASTSVVTPLVGTDTVAALNFKINGTNEWAINSASPFQFTPLFDNTNDIGQANLRIRQIFTPIIDTGTAGSGALKTNNGTTVLTWANDLSTTLAGVLRGPATMMAPITNSLGADVNLNNTANYFDGPSVAQGTAGTWFVSGTVTCQDTAAGAVFVVKLWDGTTVIASGLYTQTATNTYTCSLSGFISSPAGNLRISVKDTSSVNGKIQFNASGNSKDSTITAIRIA